MIPDDLVEEALLILAQIWPEGARVLALHDLEDETEARIAQELQVSLRTVQRWLDGYERWWDRQYVAGARDCLRTIVHVLLQAQRAGVYHEALWCLTAAWRPHQEWGAPFPATVLDFLYEAGQACSLVPLLHFLTRVRQRSGVQYDNVWRCLLDLYDRQQLQFPAPQLAVLEAAEQVCSLARLLQRLARVRQQSVSQYDQIWHCLRELDTRQRLGRLFSGMGQLPREANFLRYCRQLLQDHA